MRRSSGWAPPASQDLRSSGVVIDSVLSGGGDLGPATVVIECNLAGRVRAASGSVLHGLDGISGTVEVPEDTVVHQVPLVCRTGAAAVVIRVYGVEDDPKAGRRRRRPGSAARCSRS